MRSLVVSLVLAVASLNATAQRPLNLLFYGNSYSLDNGTVPAMVRAIAAQAGHPAPRVVPRLFGGTNLAYHRTDPAQVAAISNSLPAGEQWDYVVIQGLSVEATVNQGDPAAFRANALGIVANVRAHSPAARAVLYQTWARGPGHPFYPAAFPNIWAMHTEVRDNYSAAARDIDQANGPGTARVARAGTGVAMLGFDVTYYHPDLSHPLRPMTLLAAMTIYSAIWESAIYTINTDFDGSGPLATYFRTAGYTSGQWSLMRGYADMVAAVNVRRYAGSSEDLYSDCEVTARDTAAVVSVQVGNQLTVGLTSPNGRYSNVAAALFLDLRPQGPSTLFPELWLTYRAVPVAVGTLGTGLRRTIPITRQSEPMLLQGIALGPSTAWGGRPFTCADGQEIRIR